VLGDGTALEPGMFATIPLVAAAFKVDVVDADSKLLDEPKLPASIAARGSGDRAGRLRRPRPAMGQTPSSGPADDLDYARQQRNPASAAASRTRRDSRKTAPCRPSPAGPLVGLASTGHVFAEAGACAGYECGQGPMVERGHGTCFLSTEVPA